MVSRSAHGYLCTIALYLPPEIQSPAKLPAYQGVRSAAAADLKSAHTVADMDVGTFRSLKWDGHFLAMKGARLTSRHEDDPGTKGDKDQWPQ